MQKELYYDVFNKLLRVLNACQLIFTVSESDAKDLEPGLRKHLKFVPITELTPETLLHILKYGYSHIGNPMQQREEFLIICHLMRFLQSSTGKHAENGKAREQHLIKVIHQPRNLFEINAKQAKFTDDTEQAAL